MTIIEADPRGDVDVLSSYWPRTIKLIGEIEEVMASAIYEAIQEMIYESEDAPIYIWINSEGGSIDDAFAIYDAIQAAKQTCEVYTITFGKAYSGASLIMAAGTMGCRYINPNTSVMIHGIQCSTSAMIPFQTQMQTWTGHVAQQERLLAEAYAKCSGHEGVESIIKQYMRMLARDHYRDPPAIQQYRLVDYVEHIRFGDIYDKTIHSDEDEPKEEDERQD